MFDLTFQPALLTKWGEALAQPLLLKWEKGSQIQSPSPALGEGFRVRVKGNHKGCGLIGRI